MNTRWVGDPQGSPGKSCEEAGDGKPTSVRLLPKKKPQDGVAVSHLWLNGMRYLDGEAVPNLGDLLISTLWK